MAEQSPLMKAAERVSVRTFNQEPPGPSLSTSTPVKTPKISRRAERRRMRRQSRPPDNDQATMSNQPPPRPPRPTSTPAEEQKAMKSSKRERGCSKPPGKDQATILSQPYTRPSLPTSTAAKEQTVSNSAKRKRAESHADKGMMSDQPPPRPSSSASTAITEQTLSKSAKKRRKIAEICADNGTMERSASDAAVNTSCLLPPISLFEPVASIGDRKTVTDITIEQDQPSPDQRESRRLWPEPLDLKLKRSKRTLDVYYPPENRESTAELYEHSKKHGPQVRAENWKYCFRKDGRPNAQYQKKFSDLEAEEKVQQRLETNMRRRAQATTPSIAHQHLPSPASPDQFTARTLTRSPMQLALSPPNNNRGINIWKGKGKMQTDDGNGHLRALEERVEFNENATQEGFNRVVGRLDQIVDERIQARIAPSIEGQGRTGDRLDALVAGLRDLRGLMAEDNSATMQYLRDIRDALASSKPPGRQHGQRSWHAPNGPRFPNHRRNMGHSRN